jgi:hypothetical protein
MASTKRTWVWVVLGVVGTLVLLVVVLVGGVIFEFRRHVKNEIVATATAEQEFTRLREKFSGQQPLVEFVGRDGRDDEPTIHRPPASARRVEIHTLRVLIYDLNEGHLIHADIPGWMLRAMPYSRGGIFGADFDMGRNRVSLEELERHGLGLVLEGRNHEARILVWTE